MVSLPPRKPFPGYKWRWAALTPTESLNYPPVFLGVLRALRAHEGEPPSSPSLNKDLEIVQIKTGTRVKLARSPVRNLIRNSGQYWKIFDLLGDRSGEIELSDFGRKLADGEITKAEFAATIIKTFELPNSHVETNISAWEQAKLRIKPLELILDILTRLRISHGEIQAFISLSELVQIVIPLAGAKASITDYVSCLLSFRENKLDLHGWPDCAPEANDKRMAREFLLFLWHYGYLEKVNDLDKYLLSGIQSKEITDFIKLDFERQKPEDAVKKVKETFFPEVVERTKALQEVLQRPQQTAFRENVVRAYGGKCLISGTSLQSVLIAAHIKPVSYEGNDTLANGICLRSDIHLLFDSGHLRIERNGNIHLTQDALLGTYSHLDRKVSFPKFTNLDYVEWRWNYY